MDNFTTYTGEDVNQFIKNYRESLQAQRDSSIKQLEQQRRNDYATIMSGANKAGMLYSNLGERTKQRYNTEKFFPSLVKINSAYTTGLNSLRTNAINLWNKIKSYEEAIQDISTASQ